MPASIGRAVDLSIVIAVCLWSISGLLFIAGGIIYGLSGGHRPAGVITLATSLLVCCAACVASVKVMLLTHCRLITNAFELGRDVGRTESGVPLQRVH